MTALARTLLVLIGLFVAITAVSGVYAQNAICVLADQCVNASASSIPGANNQNFDGTAASCTQLEGTLINDPAGFYGPTAAQYCGVRCCCDVTTNTPRAVNPTIAAGTPENPLTCGSSQFQALPALPLDPNAPSFSCDAVCGSASSPQTPACVSGQPASAACTCGSQTISNGAVCCPGNVVKSAGQTCDATTTPPPQCPIGSAVTNAACTCGGTPAGQNAVDNALVCCASGELVTSAAACPVPELPGALCGNNKLDGTEQCDAPGILPANYPSTLPICQSTATEKYTCTAACTCVLEQNIDCDDGYCSAGEAAVCTGPGDNDCLSSPACTGAGVPAVTDLVATYDAAASSVNIRWRLPAQCTADSIRIGRGSTSLQAVQSKPTTLLPTSGTLAATATTFSDNALPAKTSASTLYYSVILNYPDGSTANASVQVNVPSASCPNGAATYCSDAKTAVTCDVNFGATTTSCSAGEVCAVVNNVARCVTGATDAACESCNGLFGMFRDDALLIKEGTGPGGALVDRACSAANTCYRDLRETSVTMYSSCSVINSCAGYRTPEACTANQCGKAGPCSWRTIDPETNRGVCGTTQTAFVANTCSDCALAGGGVCDANSCIAIGRAGTSGPSACAYNDPTLPTTATGGLSGPTGCVPAAQMPCEFMNTQTLCEGGSTLQLDASYVNGQRVSGTNAVTRASNDIAGHGKCVWMPTNVCRKDADGDGTADLTQYTPGLDSWALSLDFDAPSTTIQANPGVTFGSEFDVAFTTSGSLKTCFNKSGSSCYPSSTANVYGSRIKRTFTASDSGNWLLRYYAEDDARNLETVKDFAFVIDGTKPTITITRHDNQSIRTTLTGTPTYKLRVTIAFETNERATCTTELLDISGSTVSATDRGGSGTDLVDQLGTKFLVTYPALTDNAYTMRITCIDDAGNQAVLNHPVLANTDNTIFNPQPVMRTPTANLTIPISIETSNAATCYYGAFGQTLAQKTRYTTTGGTLHTATVTVVGSDEFYYETTCTILGKEIVGDRSDMIYIVTDVTPPITSTCDADADSASCEEVVFDFPQDNYRVDFQCTDLPAVNSFGCAQTFACLGSVTGTPCTPNPLTSVLDIDGTKDWRLRYYSTDNGGNAEAINDIVIAAKDVSKPLPPQFSLIQ